MPICLPSGEQTAWPGVQDPGTDDALLPGTGAGTGAVLATGEATGLGAGDDGAGACGGGEAVGTAADGAVVEGGVPGSPELPELPLLPDVAALETVPHELPTASLEL